MKRRSVFEIFLRTGRRIAGSEQLEVKFNPWHDPEDGRFTFAGHGSYFGIGAAQAGEGSTGRTRSSARPRTTPAAASARSARPKPASPNASPQRASGRPKESPLSRLARSVSPSQPDPNLTSPTRLANLVDAVERTRLEFGTIRTSLRPIPGYSETGAASWRASNDRVFIDAVNKFNSQRGLKSGDPKYVDPLLVKAWAMVESGGSKSAFLRDPLQVNNPGDYQAPKPQVTGLGKGQQMTPAISVEAALKWLEFRGYIRDKRGRAGPWIGIERAIQRYNARTDIHPSGVLFRVWYARQVLMLYDRAKKSH